MRILGIILLVAGLSNMSCVGFNFLTDMRYVNFDTVSAATLETPLSISIVASIIFLGLGGLVLFLMARNERRMGRSISVDAELKEK